MISTLDHEADFEQAWAKLGTTTVDLPPVRVNEVLRERYQVTPSFEYTGTWLWDMEVRKAKAPDVFIPTVVLPGAEKFPSVWRGQVEEFTRVSEQRLWADRADRADHRARAARPRGPARVLPG